MAGYIKVCTDYDSVTQTCVGQEVWMPASSWLPELSVADAFLIGSLILANWALAYAFKRAERQVLFG